MSEYVGRGGNVQFLLEVVIAGQCVAVGTHHQNDGLLEVFILYWPAYNLSVNYHVPRLIKLTKSRDNHVTLNPAALR